MGILTPAPSVIRKVFEEKYQVSPKEATDFYYHFSQATNYIRTDRIIKDEKWTTDTEFGQMDITINLSKPEKDPRDIAKAGAAKKSGYPACLLCRENEGYAGHFSHLSSYGVDTGDNLLHLIREVHNVDGIERIRLGSLEPRIVILKNGSQKTVPTSEMNSSLMPAH